ncbi:receptor-like protein EIX2 isoform X4 [Papaver somniferum]|uniref:receptor-like protein EIX2 isoform X4 n=1 Tax=Papaver somniferum TaxID=3469 RepID=UPI000E7024B8|nr:receptor-like protein EIX2 isoform X4 [Papaver somniferum]
MNNRILDLSRNQLSGEIPDCWSDWWNLVSISLASNYLTGEIPASIGSISTLRSLHLRNNSLSGKLPSALLKCRELRVIDISENEFTGNIPKWIGEYLFLLIFRLRFNKFYGAIPQQLCHQNSVQILDFAHNNLSEYKEIASLVTTGREFEYSNTLTLLTIMDLSDNSLSGDIPGELTNLIGLRSLNLSRNHLTGRIPNKIGNMSILESLDLSKNKLSGSVPQSIVNLTFLSHLNLSYNNLSGKIPVGTQLQGLPESSFVGNGRLCGAPLNDCNVGDVEDKQGLGSVDNETEKEKEEWFEMKWFYISVALGFAIGCWGFCGVLLVNQSWRVAYFKFLDVIAIKLCNCCSRSTPR